MYVYIYIYIYLCVACGGGGRRGPVPIGAIEATIGPAPKTDRRRQLQGQESLRHVAFACVEIEVRIICCKLHALP